MTLIPGKPFLANDPHLGLTSPSLWLLYHLSAPDVDLIGNSFAGVPGIFYSCVPISKVQFISLNTVLFTNEFSGIVIGRNKHLAWGFTNVGADIQDLYIIDEDPDGEGYWAEGSYQKYKIREEIIKIKDSAPVKKLTLQSFLFIFPGREYIKFFVNS